MSIALFNKLHDMVEGIEEIKIFQSVDDTVSGTVFETLLCCQLSVVRYVVTMVV